MVGYRFFKSNCPLVGPGTIGGMPSVEIYLRDPNPYLREFRRKPRKNSERIDRQARPGIKPPGTSHLPILSAEPLRYWWGGLILWTRCLYLKQYELLGVIFHNSPSKFNGFYGQSNPWQIQLIYIQLMCGNKTFIKKVKTHRLLNVTKSLL